MKVVKTGMFCLNSTITRQDEITLGQKAGEVMGKNQGEASVITRVDNFDLTDEQTAKIKEIHERYAVEINAILGW